MKSFLFTILFIISIISFGGEIFALKSLGDCFLVQYPVNPDGLFAQTKAFYNPNIKNHTNFSNILSEKEFNRALLNLQKVCCTDKEFSIATGCQENKSFWTNNEVPKSIYLFDHFFDILMRKLDGTQSPYEDIQADPVAKQRYTELKKIQNNETGTTNTDIDRLYKFYWTPQNNSKIIGYLEDPESKNPNNSFWDTENTTNNNANIIKNYNSISEKKIPVNLIDRYNNVCDLASYFYFSMIGSYQDTKTRDQILHNCQLTVNQRTNIETKTIINTKVSSNLRFLQSKSAEDLDYLKSRSNTLQSTLTKITATYTNIIRLSQKITPNCR